MVVVVFSVIFHGVMLLSFVASLLRNFPLILHA